MTSHDLRKTFLDFFVERGHRTIPSSSLVPDNDPSVLLTTAGMQQLKPFFLGAQNPVTRFGSKRLSSIQRCFRTSDIDAVGDASHNTFFEMLGNFSIGDYFKKEAIDYAWTFLTQRLRLPRARLWATVFSGDELTPRDEEAHRLWRAWLPPERIRAHGRDDNFWGPSGDAGPCGPSSEVHIDRTGRPCQRGEACTPNCPCGRFLELWNLVFTEWEKRADGTFIPLTMKNIDTGMGLERLALAVQNVPTIFDTDLFSSIIAAAAQLLSTSVPEGSERIRSQRIIADHLRAAVVLIADGVTFSNRDQGYVLRRIVRRALDHCSPPDLDLSPIVEAVVAVLSQTYPELRRQQSLITAVLTGEQQTYAHVIRQDVGRLLVKMRGQSVVATKALTPDESFVLYATYGISPQRLEREGYTFDRQAFAERTTKHQVRSRAGAEKKFGGHGLAHGIATAGRSPEDIEKVTRLHSATHLLHAALRSVLGDHVRQNGSDITPERLRFDFSFPRKLTDEEKKRVTDLVNEKIREDLPVSWQMLPYEKAIKQGALAFFQEKYEPTVKVYSMGTFSKELCGGPHVRHTAEIGTFQFLSEKSVAAGMRRIKAIVVGG